MKGRDRWGSQHLRKRPFPAECTESSCCNNARYKVIGFIFEDRAAESEVKIRNVIYAINTTADGCFDHTNPIADEGVLEYSPHLIRVSIDFLLVESAGICIHSKSVSGQTALVSTSPFVWCIFNLNHGSDEAGARRFQIDAIARSL
jgi:hypothetical protein